VNGHDGKLRDGMEEVLEPQGFEDHLSVLEGGVLHGVFISGRTAREQSDTDGTLRSRSGLPVWPPARFAASPRRSTAGVLSLHSGHRFGPSLRRTSRPILSYPHEPGRQPEPSQNFRRHLSHCDPSKTSRRRSAFRVVAPFNANRSLLCIFYSLALLSDRTKSERHKDVPAC
jgi:hypothetical protein